MPSQMVEVARIALWFYVIADSDAALRRVIAGASPAPHLPTLNQVAAIPRPPPQVRQDCDSLWIYAAPSPTGRTPGTLPGWRGSP